MDKYKSFFEIVKMLCQIKDWTKLRLIEKELRILLKVKSKITSKKRKKKNSKASRAMKIRAREGISLKEAWKRVK